MRSASLLISTRRLRPEPPVEVVASVCVVSVIVAVFVVLAVVVLKDVLVHGNQLAIAGRRVLDRRFLVIRKDDTFDGVFSDLLVVVGRVRRSVGWLDRWQKISGRPGSRRGSRGRSARMSPRGSDKVSSSAF
jgi:hypothetical protein